MVKQGQFIVLDEICFPDQFTALLYSNNIVELVWDKKVEIITKEMLQNVRSTLYQFGKGKRMRVYVSTFDFMETSDEAKKYSGTLEAQEYTLANAVQVDNLAKKITFNLFMKFYGTSVPSKASKTKEEAFNWLTSI